jgi:antitoxin MazE
LILEKGQIILRPIAEPRVGWDKAFQKMHEECDNQLFINDVFEDENFDEWK